MPETLYSAEAVKPALDALPSVAEHFARELADARELSPAA